MSRRWCLLIAAGSLACSDAVAADGDWQLWCDQTVSVGITERDTVRAAQSFRYAFSDDRLATYFIEAGYAHRMTDWLSVAGSLRHQWDRGADGWDEEDRPYGDATLRRKTGDFTLSDRSRVEYRIRAGRDDTFRYRNKLVLQHNRSVLGEDLKPYVSCEGFVDEGRGVSDPSRFRFTVGIGTERDPLFPRRDERDRGRTLVLDGYLMQQNTKQGDDWEVEYVLGLQVGTKF